MGKSYRIPLRISRTVSKGGPSHHYGEEVLGLRTLARANARP